MCARVSYESFILMLLHIPPHCITALEECENRHTTFLREPGTESDVWSFHIRRRVRAVEGSHESRMRARLLSKEALHDRPGAYAWSTKPQKTIYQDLYTWLRYQGR